MQWVCGDYSAQRCAAAIALMAVMSLLPVLWLVRHAGWRIALQALALTAATMAWCMVSVSVVAWLVEVWK